MEHIKILLYFISLMFGIWTVFVVRQRSMTHRWRPLRYLLRYILLFNASIFLYLIVRYAFTNIPGADPASVSPLWLIPGIFAGVSVEAGLALSFIHMAFTLRGEKVPHVVRPVFLAYAGICCAGLAAGSIILILNGSELWLRSSYFAGVIVAFITILTGLSILSFGRHTRIEPRERRAVRALGLLLLSGWVLMALEPLFPEPVTELVCATAFLWLNVAALIWLYRHFDPAYRRPRTADDEEIIARIVSRHGITKREGEIIDLILLGRSNKEIAGTLFISLNTVKNHIYSIYQKIGVNSRGQLVGMFLEDRGR